MKREKRGGEWGFIPTETNSANTQLLKEIRNERFQHGGACKIFCNVYYVRVLSYSQVQDTTYTGVPAYDACKLLALCTVLFRIKSVLMCQHIMCLTFSLAYCPIPGVRTPDNNIFTVVQAYHACASASSLNMEKSGQQYRSTPHTKCSKRVRMPRQRKHNPIRGGAIRIGS